MDPVALTAGQISDALAVIGALEVEARHVRAAVDFAATDFEHFAAAGDLVVNGCVGVEVVAVLVDVAEVNGVADLDRAGIRFFTAGEHLEQGRLAGAIRTDDADNAGGWERNDRSSIKRRSPKPLLRSFDLDDLVPEATTGRDRDLQL